MLIHNIIRYEGSTFLFKSQKVKIFRYITNYLCEILIEPENDFVHNSDFYYQLKLMRFVDT